MEGIIARDFLETLELFYTFCLCTDVHSHPPKDCEAMDSWATQAASIGLM